MTPREEAQEAARKCINWNGVTLEKEEKKPETAKRPSALSYFNSGLFMIFVGIALLNYFNSSAFWLSFGGACMFFVSALCKANKNVKEGKHMYE